MRILITGATGLVGQELTKQLHGAGHEVYYLTTSPDKIETKFNIKIKTDIDYYLKETIKFYLNKI